MRQVLEALEMNVADESLKIKTLLGFADAMKSMDFRRSPFENTGILQAVLAKALGNADPYRNAKSEMNKKAIEIVGSIERELLTFTLESAIKMSAAGNLLDYGPSVKKDEITIYEKFKEPIYGNGYEKFLDEIEKERLKIGFLADNAGEVFFDKPLVRLLAVRGHLITYFIKSHPWINDAMLEDAEIAGINNYAMLDFVPISNWELKLRGPEFLEKLRNFDVIIAKGQGNFETLGEIPNLNCFYLLIAKCKLVAKELGTETGRIVLKRAQP